MRNTSSPIVLLAFFVFLASNCTSQTNNANVNVATFDSLVKHTPNAILLDVRTPEEYNEGHLANSKNVDYNNPNFEAEINKLEKNKTILIYCLSGGRSGNAVSILRQKGFTKIHNMKGGIMAWNNAKLPTVTDNTTEEKQDKISYEAYLKLIKSKPNVIVDFYAPWCAPCMKMKPMLEKLDKENPKKLSVIRVDITENKNLAKQLNVIEIPYFKIYKNGKETWHYKGATTRETLLKQVTL